MSRLSKERQTTEMTTENHRVVATKGSRWWPGNVPETAKESAVTAKEIMLSTPSSKRSVMQWGNFTPRRKLSNTCHRLLAVPNVTTSRSERHGFLSARANAAAPKLWKASADTIQLNQMNCLLWQNCTMLTMSKKTSKTGRPRSLRNMTTPDHVLIERACIVADAARTCSIPAPFSPVIMGSTVRGEGLNASMMAMKANWAAWLAPNCNSHFRFSKISIRSCTGTWPSSKDIWSMRTIAVKASSDAPGWLPCLCRAWSICINTPADSRRRHCSELPRCVNHLRALQPL